MSTVDLKNLRRAFGLSPSTDEGVSSTPSPPLIVLGPALVIALAMLLPLGYLLVRTSTADQEAVDLILRPRTLQLALQTFALAVTVTAGAVLIALPLAWLTVRTDLPGRRIWSVIVSLPLAIPSYVGGFVIIAALGPRGILQQALAEPFGIQRLPEIYGFPGAALALILFTFPYVLLSVQAGLQMLDPALEETSRSLGLSSWRTFRKVTLPQLRPSISAGGLLVALYVLSDFGVVSLLQFDSFTRVIYVQYQSSFDRTLASAFALILVLVTLLILLIEIRSRGRATYYRAGTGSGLVQPAATVRLRRWRWPALIFCVGVATISLVAPILVLLYWAMRSLTLGVDLREPLTFALNSLYASGLGAAVSVLAAVPVGILLVRYRGVVGGMIERIIYSAYALPGIVIALSLVFFGANFATPVYQTLGLLIFAYLVRFLPQAVGAIRASLLAVGPELEEAGRSLGRSPLRVMATVTVPLIRPGIAYGAALVFLTTMKELPATLLLSPIGFKTLSTSTWSYASEGFFAQAAIPALILILVAAFPIAFLRVHERRAVS